MDKRSYARVYVEELENLHLGYPIFCPDDNIHTGDVGFFRMDDTDEPFLRLFNVLCEADDPLNGRYGVPKGFVTYETFRKREQRDSGPPGPIYELKPDHYSDPHVFKSESVTSREIKTKAEIPEALPAHFQAAVEFTFKKEASAILTTLSPGTKAEILDTEIWHKFIVQHLDSWYKFAIDKGFGEVQVPKNSIVLIKGCDKVEKWEQFTFKGGEKGASITFGASAQPACMAQLSASYSTTSSTSISPRLQKTPSSPLSQPSNLGLHPPNAPRTVLHPPNHTQTIFVRFYKIGYCNQTVLDRFRGTRAVKINGPGQKPGKRHLLPKTDSSSNSGTQPSSSQSNNTQGTAPSSSSRAIEHHAEEMPIMRSSNALVEVYPTPSARAGKSILDEALSYLIEVGDHRTNQIAIVTHEDLLRLFGDDAVIDEGNIIEHLRARGPQVHYSKDGWMSYRREYDMGISEEGIDVRSLNKTSATTNLPVAFDKLNTLLETVTLIAQGGPAWKMATAAVYATTNILEYAEKAKSNKEKIQELAVHTVTIVESLIGQLVETKDASSITELGPLNERLESIRTLLDELMAWTKQQAEQSELERILFKAAHREDLMKWRQRLDDGWEEFLRESQASTDRKQTGLSLITESEYGLLTTLEPVFTARHDSKGSPAGCLPGTRIGLLKDLIARCTQPRTAVQVYWISGPAGTGKSAIVKTLSERLSVLGSTLVVTFFASRYSQERREPLRVLHTIVHQLACISILVRTHVVEVLKSQPDILQKALKTQIETLLLAPLNQLTGSHSLIIVIDALDECQETQGIDGGTLIQDLAVVLGGLPIKLVVTSRMKRSLHRVFSTLPSERVELHKIEGDQVSTDVRLVLEQGFQKIARFSTKPWPSEKELDTLVERTGYFFLFATTVLKFVGNPRAPAERRLAGIMMRTSDNDQVAYGPIDSLYWDVLSMAEQQNYDALGSKSFGRASLQALIGTIAILQAPLSIPALAELIDIHEADVARNVDALSAVLITDLDAVESRVSPVRIFHPSFWDFLLQRCTDSRFSVDTTLQHHALAVSCLRILNQSLKYDICHVGDPTISHAQIDNPTLSTRLQHHVSEVTQYACQFWMYHIAHSGLPDRELLSELCIFAWEHVFHWIELLGLIGKLSCAILSLDSVVDWSSEHNLPTDVSIIHFVLSDALNTLRRYQHVLNTHALQIYYSGILSMPHCALFEKTQESRAQRPYLLSQRASYWGDDILILEGHTKVVQSVVLSPDGMRIVSGSHDQSVRVWNAQTGQEMMILRGHAASVLSVAFSPDGLQIASGSQDKTVRLWNVQTGRDIATLNGHTNLVTSIAFSPDGSRIASGSEDNTVRLWDVSIWHQIGALRGHTGPVQSVAFSPDSARIVSGSEDRTMRVWDAQTGREMAFLQGHTASVLSVVISPDGTRIASGSYDCTVRIWNALTGAVICMCKGHSGPVQSVTFSPDATQIASGSSDKTVRLWDAHTGHLIGVRKGHAGPVYSIAFSPDGRQLVSGSSDKTVRLWNGDSGSNVVESEGHLDSILSIAFSFDGTLIASASSDMTVRLWNSHSGRQLAQLEGLDSLEVQSVSFPQDQQYLQIQYVGSSSQSWALADTKIGETGLNANFMSQRPPHDANDVDDILQGTLDFDQDSGWITLRTPPLATTREGVHLCWLPADLRGPQFATHGENMIAIASAFTHKLTIIDFAPMLSMLRSQGVIQ